MDRNRSVQQGIAGMVESLSARRAWIEILEMANAGARAGVALRKESVDRNKKGFCDLFGIHCRSPQGERG